MGGVAIGQLVVIAVGPFFAYQQISRFRRQQEADLIQRIFATLNEQRFANALEFVYHDLAIRLTEPAYVR